MATKPDSPVPATTEEQVDDNVYQPRLGNDGFTLIPHSIYFFYIGERDKDGYNPVIHYVDAGGADPILPEMLPERLAALVENAREPTQSNQRPLPIGENWKYVVMERICHVAIAFDFEMTRDPVLRIKGENEPNVSFFDGQLLNVADCQVIACINHMKGLNGGVQPFVFELQTDPSVEWKGKGSHPDSGGTSTGPGGPPYP